MRFIGSKAKVLDFIDETINKNVKPRKGLVFADLFAGTTIVSQHFKRLGYKIISNDYLAFSYIFQLVYLKNNKIPTFNKLNFGSYRNVLNHLNELKPLKGFFYSNYCTDSPKNDYRRNYFSKKNACKIDAILKELDLWKDSREISSIEDTIIRASLIDAVTRVSNISGTYGAFLKKDDPRKHHTLKLEAIDAIPSKEKHCCYNEDILTLMPKISGDILYLDPPYNQRQYPPYYHILETISLNDNPAIYGKTGRRPYKDKLSPFCVKYKVKQAFIRLLEKARFKHIFISYNTEGLLTTCEMKSILSQFGKSEVYFYSHRRYKSNSNGTNHNKVKEILFYVRKESL